MISLPDRGSRDGPVGTPSGITPGTPSRSGGVMSRSGGLMPRSGGLMPRSGGRGDSKKEVIYRQRVDETTQVKCLQALKDENVKFFSFSFLQSPSMPVQ